MSTYCCCLHRASYTQSSKRRSQQSTRPGTGTSGAQGSTSDPSDEDVACAFAAYDVEATGHIPVAKVEGELGRSYGWVQGTRCRSWVGDRGNQARRVVVWMAARRCHVTVALSVKAAC